MKGLKNSFLRFGFGVRVFIVLISLFLIGSAVLQFPANASKKNKPSANFLKSNDLLKVTDFSLAADEAIESFKLQPVNAEFSSPRLLDFHAATGNLLVSSAQPAKLELISNETRREFLSNEMFSNLGEAKSIAAVRAKTAAFAVGEVFLGFDKGAILRVSADAAQVTKIKLPREKSPVDGGHRSH